jgi:hypothetical protein
MAREAGHARVYRRVCYLRMSGVPLACPVIHTYSAGTLCSVCRREVQATGSDHTSTIQGALQEVRTLDPRRPALEDGLRHVACGRVERAPLPWVHYQLGGD